MSKIMNTMKVVLRGKIHGTKYLLKKIDRSYISDLEQKEEIIPKGQNIFKIINHWEEI